MNILLTGLSSSLIKLLLTSISLNASSISLISTSSLSLSLAKLWLRRIIANKLLGVMY